MASTYQRRLFMRAWRKANRYKPREKIAKPGSIVRLIMEGAYQGWLLAKSTKP